MRRNLVISISGILLALLVAIVGVVLFARQEPSIKVPAVPTEQPAVYIPPTSTSVPSPTAAAQVPITAPLELPGEPLAVDPAVLTPTIALAPTQPPPTNTAAPAEAQIQPPASTKPSAAKPTAKATAKPAAPKKPDPNLLPNGVRYGDHYPKLPGRIVRISSPNIKLDCKVYEVYAVKGAWEVADYAGGHNYNSKNPGEGGNIVVSGHNNYRGEVFRYLEFLKPGDEINVWTLEGKKYTYQVESVQKLKEAGVPMAQRIENGKVMNPTPFEQLTLITCWPYTTYTHRLIVTAKPVGPVH